MASPTEPRDATPRATASAFTMWSGAIPRAPPLVLLHGITGPRAYVGHASRLALADRWRVLALDQRGPRRQPRPRLTATTRVGRHGRGSRRLRRARCGLARLLAARACPWAAAWRMRLRGRARRRRVERLVIVDIASRYSPRRATTRIRAMMRECAGARSSPRSGRSRRRSAGPIRAHDVGELRHRVKHGLRREPDGALTWKYARGAPRHDARGAARREPVDLLGAARRTSPAPPCVVRGAESATSYRPSWPSAWSAALPDGRLVEVPDAGHTVPGDRPAEFVAVVRRFLGAGR